MPWNLLILPLVAGYYLLTRCYIFKFHQQRLDRQRLIFESVLLGIGVAIITYTVRLTFLNFLPDVFNVIHKYSPFEQPYALTSLLSIGFSIALTHTYNKFSSDKKWIKRAIKDVGNELEILMKYSLVEEALMQFTLTNGKFYVAWVKELPIPSISNYVRIIPALSGYRTAETKEFKFTTHYLSVYSDYIRAGRVKNIEDLNTDIVIDITDIVTVSNFDVEMYEKFSTQGLEEQGDFS